MPSRISPSRHPLTVILGMPATGKTYLSRRLASHLGAAMADIDTVTEPVIQAAMQRITGNPDDRDSSLYKSTFREPIYDCLFSIAKENLPNVPVVLNGPFTKEMRDSNWLASLARRLPEASTILAVHVFCDLETLKRRMTQRGSLRDEAKLKDWNAFLPYYSTKAPAFPHVSVDSSKESDLESAVAEIVDRLDRTA